MKSFGEYIYHLINSINFEQLYYPFIYFFTKPNGFRGIVFSAWSKLWWQRLCQNKCSCIILVNWNVHCCVTNRKSNRLNYWLSYISDWKKLFTTVSQRINLWFHFQQCTFSLQLWFLINKTISKGDNEPSSDLHRSWISVYFMPIHSSKICIKISIQLENIGTWIQYQSSILCCFQIATDALQCRFMQMFWTKHVPCT